LTPDELAQQGLESWAGVVYELSCTVGAAIYDSNYKGEAAAESTLGGAHGTGFATTLDTSDSPAISDEVPGATTRIDP
jgi:hypothetical protein